MVIIYHNPRCSKSRQTLDLLKAQGVGSELKIIEYLQAPPSAAELEGLLKKLNLEPHQILRTKEDVYTQLGLKDKSLSRQELIQVLVENPILMERPIVVNGDRAALGRPPEKILEIL